jgi:hypothetical protein
MNLRLMIAECININPKFNAQLNHIDYVTHGVRPIDNGYCRLKKDSLNFRANKRTKMNHVIVWPALSLI